MKAKEKGKLIQLIHIAKSQIGLSDDDYRVVLEGATGRTSCTDMTIRELEEVMSAMKKLGFTAKKLPVKERDVGKASYEQVSYIKGMWEICSREKSERSLNRFIQRITGRGHVGFLDGENARKVILALREMMAKTGHDPDTAGRIE